MLSRSCQYWTFIERIRIMRNRHPSMGFAATVYEMEGKMIIVDCVSDLHGHHPKLEGGDLLIVAGDLTAKHCNNEFFDFCEWIDQQNYYEKIVVGGNHDTMLADKNYSKIVDTMYPNIYLCDSGTEFEGLKIWGSPWTKTFPGMNPKCKAFTCDTEEELAEKWNLIPEDTSILITHCPPYGIFDLVLRETKWGNKKDYTGSRSLRNQLMNRIEPELHVFGHIHEWGGKMIDTCMTKFVNASHVNERYEPVNKPIRIIL